METRTRRMREARLKPDDLKPAPEPLRLLQRFVNTRSLIRNVDVLTSSESFVEWLAELGHRPADTDLDTEELEHLLMLREGLRTILIAHTSGTAPQMDRAVTGLNHILDQKVLLCVAFSSTGEPELVPGSAGAKDFEEQLLAAAIWARHAGVWKRLKVCANEDCRWAFYDGSKNRSGSWCDMSVCGSRAKMRAYRMRQSSSADQVPSPFEET